MTPSDRVARLRADAAADALLAARRRPTRTRHRWWLVLLAAVYGALLAIVLFWPVHIDGEGGFIQPDAALAFLARLRVPVGVRYLLVESGANALLFLPLGALWAAWAAVPRYRRIATAAALGAAISLAAETVQQLVLPDRTFDLRDVLANTVGAALGAFIVVSVRVAAARGRQRDG
jgi:VanZ family protein